MARLHGQSVGGERTNGDFVFKRPPAQDVEYMGEARVERKNRQHALKLEPGIGKTADTGARFGTKRSETEDGAAGGASMSTTLLPR